MLRSPWSAGPRLATSSLRFTPQLLLGFMLTAVFWGHHWASCPQAACLIAEEQAGDWMSLPSCSRLWQEGGALSGDNTQLYVNIPQQ